MSTTMTIVNYASWVPIRPAYSWEIPAYQREVVRTADVPGDAGVVDGEALSPALAGLRVILAPERSS